MSGRTRAVIFDVDGTLADITGARHYLTDDVRRKNFQKFHAAASFLPPVWTVLDCALALQHLGVPLIVVTARREQWRYRTSTWLRKYGVTPEHLMMRPDRDDRRDVEVKRDILARIRTRYEPVLAFDDNPSITALWVEEGIPCVLVPGWDIEPAA
jgi:FMN phosphatase YigB (HAD superfamily)